MSDTDIEAKIAMVVDEYQVALNAGSLAGVTVGSEVSLFRDVKVVDPDTKEALGSFGLRRARFKVNFVQENLSVARITDHAAKPAMFNALVPRALKRVVEDPSRRNERNDDVVYVKVGDIVSIAPAEPGDDDE